MAFTYGSSFYYRLLSFRYSRSVEEAEEALDESPDGWQIPCLAIQEFVKSIVLVFNATFGLAEIKGFVDYYWKNQSQYPQTCQLSEIDYKLLNLVIEKEFSSGDICSSLQVLSKSNFFNQNQTQRSNFMLNVAIEFIDAIHNGSINKNFSLLKDLTAHERFERYRNDGHDDQLTIIPLEGYEQYYKF